MKLDRLFFVRLILIIGIGILVRPPGTPEHTLFPPGFNQQVVHPTEMPLPCLTDPGIDSLVNVDFARLP